MGKEYVTTPVLSTERNQSYLQFSVIVDYFNNLFRYVITDINVNERLLKINKTYFDNAPFKNFDILGSENINVPFAQVSNINIVSKGRPNYVHQNRILAVKAERDGYVNIVINERKYLDNLQEKDKANIAKMDLHIEREMSIYKLEYETALKFISEMQSKICNTVF